MRVVVGGGGVVVDSVLLCEMGTRLTRLIYMTFFFLWGDGSGCLGMLLLGTSGLLVFFYFWICAL